MTSSNLIRPVRSQWPPSKNTPTPWYLARAEGGTIRAIMSRSLLQRADDNLALITFQDVTEMLGRAGH